MESSSTSATTQSPESGALGGVSEQVDDKLIEFIETLTAIDVNGPLAELNETTISDNNGGRIKL